MTDLPAELVDRAAQAIALYHGDTDCEDRPQVAKYRAQAEAALAAALEGCEVREQWSYRSHWERVPGYAAKRGVAPIPRDNPVWISEAFARHEVANAKAVPRSVIHRYVITTRPEEETPADG